MSCGLSRGIDHDTRGPLREPTCDAALDKEILGLFLREEGFVQADFLEILHRADASLSDERVRDAHILKFFVCDDFDAEDLRWLPFSQELDYILHSQTIDLDRKYGHGIGPGKGELYIHIHDLNLSRAQTILRAVLGQCKSIVQLLQSSSRSIDKSNAALEAESTSFEDAVNDEVDDIEDMAAFKKLVEAASASDMPPDEAELASRQRCLKHWQDFFVWLEALIAEHEKTPQPHLHPLIIAVLKYVGQVHSDERDCYTRFHDKLLNCAPYFTDMLSVFVMTALKEELAMTHTRLFRLAFVGTSTNDERLLSALITDAIEEVWIALIWRRPGTLNRMLSPRTSVYLMTTQAARRLSMDVVLDVRDRVMPFMRSIAEDEGLTICDDMMASVALKAKRATGYTNPFSPPLPPTFPGRQILPRGDNTEFEFMLARGEIKVYRVRNEATDKFTFEVTFAHVPVTTAIANSYFDVCFLDPADVRPRLYFVDSSGDEHHLGMHSTTWTTFMDMPPWQQRAILQHNVNIGRSRQPMIEYALRQPGTENALALFDGGAWVPCRIERRRFASVFNTMDRFTAGPEGRETVGNPDETRRYSTGYYFRTCILIYSRNDARQFSSDVLMHKTFFLSDCASANGETLRILGSMPEPTANMPSVVPAQARLRLDTREFEVALQGHTDLVTTIPFIAEQDSFDGAFPPDVALSWRQPHEFERDATFPKSRRHVMEFLRGQIADQR
ncbi:hypothetical protein PENSPDRAFT_165114 [Peniophora sp. CONT]|nr:hypothetical protein PENSPDRAFT_165114 [Peniophora sp. CONT]